MQTGELQQQERPRRRQIEDVLVAKNKAMARSILEDALSKGDMSVLDAVVADDVIFYDVASPEPGRGIAAFRAYLESYRAAFPDIRIDIQQLVAEGDSVVALWSGSGTHEGDLMGIAPTHAFASGVSGLTVNRYASGKLVEARNTWNLAAWLHQVGADLPYQPTPSDLEQARLEIAAMLDGLSAAFSRSDAKSASELFTADGSVISPAGNAGRSRAEVERVIADDLAGFLRGSTSQFKLAALRLQSPALASVDLDHNLTGLASNFAADGKMALHVAAVLRKVGGRWLCQDARPYAFMG